MSIRMYGLNAEGCARNIAEKICAPDAAAGAWQLIICAARVSRSRPLLGGLLRRSLPRTIRPQTLVSKSKTSCIPSTAVHSVTRRRQYYSPFTSPTRTLRRTTTETRTTPVHDPRSRSPIITYRAAAAMIIIAVGTARDVRYYYNIL